jgi:hypothetical protein
LRHQAHFGDHGQERMQTGLESLAGVTHGDPFLMPVLGIRVANTVCAEGAGGR